MEMQGNRWFVGFSRDVTERNRGARELQHTQEQMAVAREIQQRLFPKSPPRLPGYDIAGASYTADAAGGDYYDYIEMLNGRIGLVVGDVTGHGIGPALLMAETRAYLRLLARNREDVGEILSRACLVLADDVDFERYVTLILVSLDPVKRELIYSSAGHPPCYVIDENGAIKGTMRRTGVPLGLKRDAAYANAGPIQLAPGDLVLVVTDGIEEAMSVEGEFFGTERLIQTVQKSRHLSSAAIVEAVYHEVTLFALNAPQLDDITMIVVKVT